MGTEASKLKRTLGFWDVFFIAVGQIIGAGVIALTGIAIGMTGPSVTIAYFGAALLVIISSVLYMVAGASIPSIGAFYVWPARLVNGWLGSIVLFLILLASITLSLYGGSFGMYLNPLFPSLSVNAWGVLAISIFFVANLFGLNIASKVQIFLVLILVSALAVYAGFAMPEIKAANLTPMFPKGMIGFLTAIFLLKFATGGAYLIVVLGGEMKNPQRDIPLVLIIATLAVSVIYGFVALASVGVIPWEKMVNQPLTVAGKAFLPGWAFMYFLIAGAGLAICTTLNAQFIQLPRNFIVASWDNLIPAWMGKTNKYGAPYIILIAMVVIGVVPLVVGLDIGSIARAASIAAILPGFFIYWAVTRIPKKFPEKYQASKLQLSGFWLWVFFVLSTLSMLIGVLLLSKGLSKPVLITLTVWIILSIVYYPLRRSFLKKKGIDLDALTSDPAVMEMT